jgi:ubiquinone/menaquinone biosynthesis C-methylase UbiE
MSDTDKVFAGAIPEIYDRFLVPILFEPYAADLAGRAGRLQPREVLETAAGTGVLTRALAKLLPQSARIIATDLNQPMLDRAAAPQTGGAQVTTRQADALNLPFVDASFDVVLCQFGAMFFPDKVRAYAGAHRVLKPGGHFLFNVWSSIAENEFADSVTRALAELLGPGAPNFMARIPHGYHDIGRIEQELHAAGFASIPVETVEHASRAVSARDAAIAFCQGTPIRNEIDARFPGRHDEATRFVAGVLARRFGTGPITGRMQAHVFVATRN